MACRIFRCLGVMFTILVVADGARAQQVQPGTEEFGMSMKELVKAAEEVEQHIAKCMRAQGFEYIPVDFKTIRKGMVADKSLPGMDEEEFIDAHGFGISTFYTGKAPQLAESYCPGKVGFGARNVQIFKGLSPADQVAYNRALLGENTDATFAVALELENFSRCGGCTLEAVKKVFPSDQLKATYIHPLDALINKDPRMKTALRKYAEAMRLEGFDYNHPDDVEPEITERLHAITGQGTIPFEQLSSEQQEALKKLQEFERRVSVVSFRLQEEHFDPIEEQIEREMYAHRVE